MAKLEINVFERAMCCPGGGCGSTPDQDLLEFSKTLKMIEKKYGKDVLIKRGTINFDFAMFTKDKKVLMMINEEGLQTLPIIIINDRIVAKGSYPSFEVLDRNIEIMLAPIVPNKE